MTHCLRCFIIHWLKRRYVRNANRQKARRRLFLEVLEDRTVPSPVFTRNGFQSETSIAADDSGKHVVIGFYDLAGFNPTPVIVSGFDAPDDGGRTGATGEL